MLRDSVPGKLSPAYQPSNYSSAYSILSCVKAAWLMGTPQGRQHKGQSISAVVMFCSNADYDELTALKQEVGQEKNFMHTTEHKWEDSVSATNRFC